MRKSYIKTIFTILFCSVLITACSGRYKNIKGITLIAPLGNPPIDYIAWSPIDQDKILVTAAELGQGPTEVYILNISSKEKNVLVKSEYGGVWARTWLPDAKHILLVVNNDNREFNKGGYWIISIGNNLSEFFRASGDPVWSPNGKKIALYTIVQNSDPNLKEIELRLLDVVTNNEEIIYSSIGKQKLFGLSWSPDGQKLVYSLGDFNSSNIYIIDIDTRKTTQLTKSETNDTPTWSPKGDIIAYNKVSDNGIKSSLHLIRPDGSCDIEIPNMNNVRSPTWSPDGKKLAFVASDGIYYLEISRFFGESGYQSLCP